MLNGILFRPLPVEDAHRLVRLLTKMPDIESFLELSYPNFRDIRKANQSFEEMTTWEPAITGVSTPSFAVKGAGYAVSGNYFEFLGLQPAVGRFFLAGDDEEKGSQPVIVLGNAFWKSHFGGDPDVVGQTLRLNNNPFEIVGVTGEEFHGTEVVLAPQFFTPMSMLELAGAGNREARRSQNFRVLAKLRQGVSVETAQAEMDLVMVRLADEHPTDLKDATLLVLPELKSRPDPSMHEFMPYVAAMFLSMVSLVLLIACANIANLTLARGLGRSREVSVKAALGASRWRLIRQLLTESVVLAVLGGAAGLLFTVWVAELLEGVRPPSELPFHFDYSLDSRVFAFTAATTLLTVFLSGLMPAVQASSPDLHSAMKEGGQRSSEGRGGSRTRSVLVAAEIAFATVLLVVAGLFLRSLEKGKGVYIGVEPDQILMATVSPSSSGYDLEKGKGLLDQILAEATQLPGVSHAAFTRYVPFGHSTSVFSAYPEGVAPTPDEPLRRGIYTVVSDDYFQTVRTAILRGRAFDERDHAGAPKVAIANEKFAETFWPGEDALGKRMMRGRDKSGDWYEVVGIVPTGKYQFLGEQDVAYVYLPWAQHPRREMTFQLRTAGSPPSLAPAFRELVRSIDSTVAVSGVFAFDDFIYEGRGLMHIRLTAMLMTAFSVIGLALAAIGVYGSLSYLVSRRTSEIGVRMAIGADRASVIGLVMSSGFKLVGWGLALGLVVTLGISRFVGPMLVDVSPTDPLTYFVVGMFLVLLAFLACYIPARRAARLDPVQALRQE